MPIEFCTCKDRPKEIHLFHSIKGGCGKTSNALIQAFYESLDKGLCQVLAKEDGSPLKYTHGLPKQFTKACKKCNKAIRKHKVVVIDADYRGTSMELLLLYDTGVPYKTDGQTKPLQRNPDETSLGIMPAGIYDANLHPTELNDKWPFKYYSDVFAGQKMEYHLSKRNGYFTNIEVPYDMIEEQIASIHETARQKASDNGNISDMGYATGEDNRILSQYATGKLSKSNITQQRIHLAAEFDVLLANDSQDSKVRFAANAERSDGHKVRPQYFKIRFKQILDDLFDLGYDCVVIDLSPGIDEYNSAITGICQNAPYSDNTQYKICWHINTLPEFPHVMYSAAYIESLFTQAGLTANKIENIFLNINDLHSRYTKPDPNIQQILTNVYSNYLMRMFEKDYITHYELSIIFTPYFKAFNVYSILDSDEAMAEYCDKHRDTFGEPFDASVATFPNILRQYLLQMASADTTEKHLLEK